MASPPNFAKMCLTNKRTATEDDKIGEKPYPSLPEGYILC